MAENKSFQDAGKVNYKHHTKCRVCSSENMHKYLDLGKMPLPNDLSIASGIAINKPTMPLEVLFCDECGLSQLSVVVDPKDMYSYYTYRSGINKGYLTHCQEMAEDLKNRFALNEDSFHVDVAGNDGSLLKEFKKIINHKVLNIDPARNLIEISNEEGVNGLCDYWELESAEIILNEYGKADLITATNVFAHVDNVKDFILSAKLLLKKDGVLVMEFPYLIDFMDKCEFDTIYFEHLSYFSVIPLLRLCNITGMKLISVEKQKIHGGTIRVTIADESSSHEIDASVSAFVNKEINGGFDKITAYDSLLKCSDIIKVQLNELLTELKNEGKTVYGFGASAKGNTLLNSAMIDNNLMQFIIDETPEKINHYSPKNGVMIKSLQLLKDFPCDYLVILAWNFSDEIIKKVKPFYRGKFIIPIPNVEVV